MMRPNHFLALVALVSLATASTLLRAAPYASQVTISGTQVSFVLNQDADTLTYSLNGGAATPLGDGTGAGLHTFNLNSGSDTFSIVADKTENGFLQLDGNTVAADLAGMPVPAPEAYYTPISDDTNIYTHYNSPRGVAVGTNPNQPSFGAVYVSNSANGTPTGRTLGKGMYVINADLSDATTNTGSYGYGYGDTAQFTGFFDAPSVSANSPYRLQVADDGNVYISGFADGASGVFQASPDLVSLNNVLSGTTGPFPLPAGQNHGSVLQAVVVGSTATNDMVIYTIDEDLSPEHVAGTGDGTALTNSVWRYDINGSALPYSAMPTFVKDAPIPNVSNIFDLARGPDGKLYFVQVRSNGTDVSSLQVLDASGTTLFASLPRSLTAEGDYDQVVSTASAGGVPLPSVNAADYVLWRKAVGTTGDPVGAIPTDGNGDGTVNGADYDVWQSNFGVAAADILRNGNGGPVISPDGKWMAFMQVNNNIMLIPLVDGLPDLANRQAISVPNTTGNARQITFDAAGNLYYVSSGQQLLRELAPGGHTTAETHWDGSAYSFNITNVPGAGSSVGGSAVPEPGTLLLALAGLLLVSAGRRRK